MQLLCTFKVYFQTHFLVCRRSRSPRMECSTRTSQDIIHQTLQTSRSQISGASKIPALVQGDIALNSTGPVVVLAVPPYSFAYFSVRGDDFTKHLVILLVPKSILSSQSMTRMSSRLLHIGCNADAFEMAFSTTRTMADCVDLCTLLLMASFKLKGHCCYCNPTVASQHRSSMSTHDKAIELAQVPRLLC